MFDLAGYDTTVDVVLENHFDNTTGAQAMKKLAVGRSSCVRVLTPRVHAR